MTTLTTTAPTARPADRSTTTTPGKRQDARAGWLFVAPFALFYALFLIVPTIYMLVTSFFNTSLVRPGLGSFAGFANYAEMLGRADFRDAMGHTLWFTVITTVPLVILSFVFAVLANRIKRGQWFFRLAFFVPFVLPSATISLIWVFLFTPDTGLWPSVQKAIGLSPTAVLADPAWALWGVAIATIWWTIGFNFVLYLAGLQEIPRELYEAAATDGATPWQQIRLITLPLLGRTTTLVVLLQIIASLKIFDQVYLMTSGGPGISTQVALTTIAGVGFTDNRIGAASAASVILFIVIIVIAVVRQMVERAQERRA